MVKNLKRCFANDPHQELYAQYHDNEWGKPVYDDKTLFEFLILEGAQAGLSWETILKRRMGYRKAFYHFSVNKVAKMTDKELDLLCTNPDIIRNKRKIYSTRQNAQVFIAIKKEYKSFSNYLWQYVDNKPIVNNWQTARQIPTSTPISEAISKDLKKRGMSFVGPTIIYAYMQAVGLVDDHLISCCCRNKS